MRQRSIQYRDPQAVPPATHSTVVVYFPTREDILDVHVGGCAPDPFGKYRRVAEVTYRGTDFDGRAYVGYKTELGRGTVSNSLKEGQILRSVPLSSQLTSAQVDRAEELMRQEPDRKFVSVD